MKNTVLKTSCLLLMVVLLCGMLSGCASPEKKAVKATIEGFQDALNNGDIDLLSTYCAEDMATAYESKLQNAFEAADYDLLYQTLDFKMADYEFEEEDGVPVCVVMGIASWKPAGGLKDSDNFTIWLVKYDGNWYIADLEPFSL